MKNFKNYKGYALYILLTCVLCVGCNKPVVTETKVEIRETVYVYTQIEKEAPKDILVFDIRVARFCYTGTLYGNVGEGSCLFPHGEIMKGYLIITKKGDKVVSREYCKKEEIEKTIKEIRFYRGDGKDDACVYWDSVANAR